MVGYRLHRPPGLTDEQLLVADVARRFLAETCPSDEVRRLASIPEGFERRWWRQAAELGWLGLLVPDAHGGGAAGGSGVVDLALVAGEVGRAVGPGPLAPSALVAAAVARSPAAEVRGQWLEPLLTGEAIGAWCLAEAGSWDRSGVALVARPVGGGYQLDGTKGPVEAAGQADVLLVTARAPDRLVELVVPAAAPGVEVTALESLDLVRRFATVGFDAVTVPARAVIDLGPASGGVGELLEAAWLVIQCAEMVGAAGAMLERTVAYAFDRVSFGRPLASYQALKHRFADLVVAVEGAAAIAAGAAEAVDDALVGTADPDPAVEAAHAAKVHAGELLPAVLQDCVQLHGGIGVTWEHDLHLYLRRVVQDRALLGSPAEHAERLARRAGLGDQGQAA
jgi:alkylation response protein AidB-like acyl-CoA dehydrogenase